MPADAVGEQPGSVAEPLTPGATATVQAPISPDEQAASAGAAGSKEQKDFLTSLERFIRATAGGRSLATSTKPGLRAFALLALIAIDIAALLVLFFSNVHHPLVDMVEKIMPILFGSTLVTWFDEIRAKLFLISRSRLAWATASVGFLAVVPLIHPYGIRSPGRFVTVSVDGGPPTLLRHGAYLKIGSLGQHALNITEKLPLTGREVTDALHVGPYDLITSALGGLMGRTYEVGVRISVTVSSPDSSVEALIVEGDIPLLVAGEGRFQHQLHRRFGIGPRYLDIPLDDVPLQFPMVPRGGPWMIKARRRSSPETSCEVAIGRLSVPDDSPLVISVPNHC